MNLIDRFAEWWLAKSTERYIKHNPEISEKFQLKRAEFTPGGMDILMLCPDIVMLANEAAALLRKNNAKNYVQFDMMPRLDKGVKPIRVTIQWAEGMSPAVKNAELEKKIKVLEALLHEVGIA